MTEADDTATHAADDTATHATVLFAHGSRRTEANEDHLRLCSRLSAATTSRVNAAFLELAAPDLDTAVDALVADGVRRITVLPYFLHEGRHTTVDLPALAEAARLRHPMVTVEVSPAFGSHPQVTEVLASLIASPASSPATSLRVTSLRAISPASTSPTQE